MSFVLFLSPARTSADEAGGKALPYDRSQIASDLVNELGGLYHTQGADGALDLRGTRDFLRYQPILATLTLEAQTVRPNAAFLSQSASAIARYYGYLFGNDINANLLVETRVASRDGDAIEVEDVGFNALLSLDILNLAQLNVDMRRPVRALYWYEGARTIQENLVQALYDPESNFFYPRSVSDPEIPLRNYYTLSLAPALFARHLGENRVAGMVSEYLLNSKRIRFPEQPGAYLSAGVVGSAGDSSAVVGSARLLRTALSFEVLRRAGHNDLAERCASAASANLSALVEQLPPGRRMRATQKYLINRIYSGSWPEISSRLTPLHIFVALVNSARAVDENTLVRFNSNANLVESVLGNGGNFDEKRAEDAIRSIFTMASTTREKVKAGEFFTRDDMRALGSINSIPAMDRLLDDVGVLLREAENRVFERRYADADLRVTAISLNERVVVGTTMKIRWRLQSRALPMEIHAVTVYTAGDPDVIIPESEHMLVNPAAGPTEFESQFRIHEGATGSLIPIVATLEFRDASGTQSRFNVERTVFLDEPVTVVAEFPNGVAIDGARMPMALHVYKRVPEPVNLQMSWYSPAGLRLVEDLSSHFVMEADQDTGVVHLTVVPPDPCRPGPFPFKLKVFGNGRDLGTISSSLYKPFQWIFIGPFDPGKNPMGTGFPPEREVDLSRSYSGKDRQVSWALARKEDFTSTGHTALRRLLDAPGVSYLYTVIETEYDAHTPVTLSANVPSRLIVNGTPVLDGPSSGATQPVYGRIDLRAGLNDILIKLVGDESAVVDFKLGDEREIASDEFNNELSETLEGFKQFRERSQSRQLVTEDDVHKTITIRYVNPTASSVAVMGSFNGWSPQNAQMRRVKDGTWEISLSLAPGKYAYHFLIDNTRQIPDPASPYTESDGYGGQNSVLFVKR